MNLASSKPSKDFILIAPRAGALLGHHVDFVDGLLRRAAAEGYRACLLANARLAAPALNAAQVVRCFGGGADGRRLPSILGRRGGAAPAGDSSHPMPAAAPGTTSTRLGALKRFVARLVAEVPFDRDLIDGLRVLGSRSAANAVVVACDLTYEELDQLAAMSPPVGWPAWCPVVLLRGEPGDRAMHLTPHHAGRLAARLRRNGCIRLGAETRALAAAYSRILGVEVFRFAAGVDVPPELARRPPEQPPIVGFFGEARQEKGFARLPELAEHLMRNTAARLYIHASGNGDVPSETFDALARFPADRVTIERNFLPRRAYLERLAAASVIVLPYEPGAYRVRGSGVLAEALAMGRVVVVPANTGLAEAADGLVVPYAPQPGGLERALVEALERARHPLGPRPAGTTEREDIATVFRVIEAQARRDATAP